MAVPRRSAFDSMLEAGSLGALLAIFGVVGLNWKNLPARVPRHFNALGNPNAWGVKSADRDAPEVQSLLLGISILLKTIVPCMLLYLVWANVNTAMGRYAGLRKPFLPASLAAILVPTGLYMFKLRRYRN